MKTPDTEWETVDRYSVDTGLLKRFFKLYEEGRKTGDPQNFIDYFKAEHYLLTEVGKALTSRDTHWKERVDAEIADAVELTKREIKHRVERYFKDAYLSLKQQGGVHIHLEEIQEIIDDSTPPGFAPTPLQDK